MPELVGKTLVNQYQIMEKIGAGGMASVYRAWDRERNCTVAVKIMDLEQNDETGRQRFRDEARVLVELNHPHIVRFYELVEDRECGFLFIVMDCIEGQSLAKLIEHGERESLEWSEVIRIAHQIGSALNYAHKKHVYHRDIKPSNILLDKKGTAYLADFGVALLTRRSRYTAAGHMVGTLDYAAPEQLGEGTVDARADIYSLGALLYELLTGRPPFTTRDYLVLIRQIYNVLPDPPSRHNPRVPPKVDQVILKALQKDPRDRYPSVACMINALLASLEIPDGLEPFDEQSVPEDNAHSRYDADFIARDFAVPGGVKHQPQTARFSRRRWFLVIGATVALLAAAGLWIGSRLDLASLFARRPETLAAQAAVFDEPLTLAPIPTAVPTATPVPPTATSTPTPFPTPTTMPTLAASPTRTLTPSPTPTLTSLPTSSPTPYLVAIQDQIDVYSGPGENYRALGQVNQGDELVILGCSPSGTWWQVDYLGWPGWIVAKVALSSASIESVPTVLAPPVPVNHPPGITSMQLEPPTIEAWSTISMTCQASDPDGDPLTYDWQVSKGTVVGEGEAVSYIAPDREISLTITVTVRDRYGGQAVHALRTRVVDPQPPPGALEPAGIFGQVWSTDQDVRRRLGWAMEEEQVTFGAQQGFEKGIMFWRDDTDEIYGLTQDGQWQVYAGRWQEGMDEYTCPEVAESKTPPTPKRGFGEIWCEQMGGPNAAIGWAIADEQGYYPHWQSFERGLMWSGHDGRIYVFYQDNTWESVSYQ